MKLSYKTSIAIETTKVVLLSIALAALLGLMLKNCRIKHYQVELNKVDKPEGNRLVIEKTNPYKFTSFFIPYDLSVSSYTYIFEDDGSEMQYYGFQSGDELTEYNLVSDVFHSDTNPMALTVAVLSWDMPKPVSFYTKFLRSEDVQSFRTFFYSEVFALLLAILCNSIWKLFNYYYRRNNGRSILINERTHIRLLLLYLVLTVLLINLIFIISHVHTYDVKEKQYTARSGWTQLFMPYDISRSYYNINTTLSEDSRDTIVWKTNELVAFKDINKKPKIKTLSSIEFHPLYDSDGFHGSFYTENFHSKNLQETRLFLLTTLVLLVIARMVIHIVKVFKSKFKWLR